MSDHTDTTRTVMEMVSAAPTSDLEDVIAACCDLTWNQVFHELDRLSRTGHIVLKQIHPGRYRVMPGDGARPTLTHS
jgi:hypothetical protein